MKKYIFGFVIMVMLPSVALAQVYTPNLEAQKEQVQYIIDLVQTLPSATNEQLTQKINLLQQALQLQIQVNALQYHSLIQPNLPIPLQGTYPIIQSTPSVFLYSNPQANLQGNVVIRQGDSITITGLQVNLVGVEGAGYSKAFFFDPLFNSLCGATNPPSSWSILCTATKVGTSKFYIEVYQGGQTYRSNTINVTVTNRDGFYVDDPQAGISVQTGGVDQGTPTSGRLVGYVSRAGNQSDTLQVWFEWSTDPYLDGSYNLPIVKSTPKNSFNLRSGMIGTSATLVNLLPSTVYYYRLVVSSGTSGTQRGEIRQFNTEPQYPQAYYY